VSCHPSRNSLSQAKHYQKINPLLGPTQAEIHQNTIPALHRLQSKIKFNNRPSYLKGSAVCVEELDECFTQVHSKEWYEKKHCKIDVFLP
jgi:hypothetical protein